MEGRDRAAAVAGINESGVELSVKGSESVLPHEKVHERFSKPGWTEITQTELDDWESESGMSL